MLDQTRKCNFHGNGHRFKSGNAEELTVGRFDPEAKVFTGEDDLQEVLEV